MRCILAHQLIHEQATCKPAVDIQEQPWPWQDQALQTDSSNTVLCCPVLRDPSVATSSVENRIAFLKAKNLTEEEINVALARVSTPPSPNVPYPQSVPPPPQYYGQYPPYGWQPTSPEIPRRDWRDWFIMATVVSGVGYGLFSLTKV
jgi:hypothetical protein